MNRVDAYRMVRRRTAEAGFKIKLGCHVFRVTGGTLENAQAMAAHESPRTTKLYDHTGDEITLDEVERITIFLRGAALTKQGAFEEAVAWPTRGPRRPPRCRLAAALRSG